MIAGLGKADQASGLDVFLVALDERHAAHSARILDPVGQADGNDEDPEVAGVDLVVLEDGADDAVDQQRDEDRGEGQLDVGDAHNDRVDFAADITGDQSERDADAQREGYGEDADGDR